MDVIECRNSFCLFSAVTEHGGATHISMACNERLLQKYSGGEKKRTRKDTSRDKFDFLPKSLLGQAKRIKVDRAAFAQNDEKFIGNNFAVEENEHVEQLHYDEKVVDLGTPKEGDDVFKLSCTHYLEIPAKLQTGRVLSETLPAKGELVLVSIRVRFGERDS